mmetsp:Transcript_20628/g.48225  ORF Transcript_20628/g.48225 Transcript_20628/m.48225 type:complete len:344 (+) Transcript_20628:340-1371(+)
MAFLAARLAAAICSLLASLVTFSRFCRRLTSALAASAFLVASSTRVASLRVRSRCCCMPSRTILDRRCARASLAFSDCSSRISFLARSAWERASFFSSTRFTLPSISFFISRSPRREASAAPAMAFWSFSAFSFSLARLRTSFCTFSSTRSVRRRSAASSALRRISASVFSMARRWLPWMSAASRILRRRDCALAASSSSFCPSRSTRRSSANSASSRSVLARRSMSFSTRLRWFSWVSSTLAMRSRSPWRVICALTDSSALVTRSASRRSRSRSLLALRWSSSFLTSSSARLASRRLALALRLEVSASCSSARLVCARCSLAVSLTSSAVARPASRATLRER